MPSLVNIYNKALAHIGKRRLTSENDLNNRAETCNDMYEFALKSTLEAREWTFATRRTVLLPDTSATPAWGYNYAFKLPNDVLRVLECRDGRFNQDMAWEVEGDYLYSTRPSASIRLLFLQENTLKFSPQFVEMLAIKLAADICVALTENRALALELEAKYERMKAEAAALDGLQASRERLRSDRLINARYYGIATDRFPYQDGTGSVEGTDLPPPPVAIPPQGSITGPTSVQVGDSADFSAAIIAGTEPIAFQWQKDGVDIAGATGSTYSIPSATVTDAGSYSCAFSNAGGSSSSNSVRLIIGCVAPSCVVSGPTQVDEGVEFTYAATVIGGNEPITFQWRKDGVDIAGATGQEYTKVALATDAGAYDCTASNVCASAIPSSNQIQLSVVQETAPAITITPSSATPIAPDTVEFTCNVVDNGGDPAITFQWYLGGAPVGTNSPTYTTPATTAGVQLVVECVATNSGGDSNRPFSVVNPVANLIATTAFDSNGSLILNANTAWVEAQGVGGGGGGGSGRAADATSEPASAGGGGGAGVVSIFGSAVVQGATLTATLGQGGAGGPDGRNNGSDGTNSSLSGGGLVGFLWGGGKGGQAAQAGGSGDNGAGGNGGNNSAGVGGGAGGGLGLDGANGVGGGGGGGGGYNSGFGAGGGDGGGTNGGKGGASAGGSAFGSSGGGGGGTSAVWWDGAPAGNGGAGSSFADGGAVAGPGTGNGNGGGGSGLTILGTVDAGSGSDGRIVVRQYRRQP